MFHAPRAVCMHSHYVFRSTIVLCICNLRQPGPLVQYCQYEYFVSPPYKAYEYRRTLFNVSR